MADNKNNPKNSEASLFKKLTKLFSGPIINYRSQTTRQLRRRRLDKYATTFRDVAGQKFQRIGYNPFDNLSAHTMHSQNRVQRYADFQQMEFTPEIASALDIYADEMTTNTKIKRMLNIKCNNEEIKSILDTLYYNILNIEFNLFGWSRTLCKYGDFYLYLDIDDTVGIKNVIGLPAGEVERLEGEDKTNPNYVQYQWNTAGVTFENWQMAHFRILGNDKYAPYGTSMLDAARRIWRQLTLLEDAMMAYRIVRSPERRVFYVDVGNIPPQDVEQYMQGIITKMKRNQIVDPDTGRVDLRYNPMSVDEDYFIPVRGGVSTRIETLQGGSYTGDVDDVKYMRDKLFSALKVPHSYLSRGEGADEDKSTLAQKDIRFARTIQRLQRSIVAELEKIGIIHLYTLGFRGDDLVSFKLSLNNPSKIAELQDLEHWRSKFEVASGAIEGFFSKRWVATNLLEISEEEFLRNQRELFYDKYVMSQLEATAEEAGAGLGAPTGELGELGGEELGAEELGGEELEGEEPAAEEGEEGGESALLAAPGKRDDSVYKLTKRDATGRTTATTTSGAKGKWYEPTTSDKRDMGARKRHFLSQASNEKGKVPRRQLYPGAAELISLGKGISEELNTNYKDEEKKLFEVNTQITNLIKELESKDDDTQTQ